jgi:hypothetical protein
MSSEMKGKGYQPTQCLSIAAQTVHYFAPVLTNNLDSVRLILSVCYILSVLDVKLKMNVRSCANSYTTRQKGDRHGGRIEDASTRALCYITIK